MAAVQAKSIITPFDRLSLTVILAIIIHAIIILGVHFIEEDRSLTRYHSMEVVLVQQQSQQPNEADLLAPANLEGGGDAEEEAPSVPTPAPFPDQKAQLTSPPSTEAMSSQTATPEVDATELVPVKQDVVETIAVEDPDSAIATVENMDIIDKEKQLTKKNELETTKTKPTPKKDSPVKETVKNLNPPSAMELLANSLKIASLSAEIQRKKEDKANRPRRKHISANTKEFKYAAYMDAWRAKVERVGNLNYPEKARQQNLSGDLILDVALNVDGSINQITVRRSSGKKILDAAAVRIVELAAPYAPFPQDIKEGIDILHILRTWQFINKKGFQ